MTLVQKNLILRTSMYMQAMSATEHQPITHYLHGNDAKIQTMKHSYVLTPQECENVAAWSVREAFVDMFKKTIEGFDVEYFRFLCQRKI